MNHHELVRRVAVIKSQRLWGVVVVADDHGADAILLGRVGKLGASCTVDSTLVLEHPAGDPAPVGAGRPGALGRVDRPGKGGERPEEGRHAILVARKIVPDGAVAKGGQAHRHGLAIRAEDDWPVHAVEDRQPAGLVEIHDHRPGRCLLEPEAVGGDRSQRPVAAADRTLRHRSGGILDVEEQDLARVAVGDCEAVARDRHGERIGHLFDRMLRLAGGRVGRDGAALGSLAAADHPDQLPPAVRHGGERIFHLERRLLLARLDGNPHDVALRGRDIQDAVQFGDAVGLGNRHRLLHAPRRPGHEPTFRIEADDARLPQHVDEPVAAAGDPQRLVGAGEDPAGLAGLQILGSDVLVVLAPAAADDQAVVRTEGQRAGVLLVELTVLVPHAVVGREHPVLPAEVAPRESHLVFPSLDRLANFAPRREHEAVGSRPERQVAEEIPHGRAVGLEDAGARRELARGTFAVRDRELTVGGHLRGRGLPGPQARARRTGHAGHVGRRRLRVAERRHAPAGRRRDARIPVELRHRCVVALRRIAKLAGERDRGGVEPARHVPPRRQRHPRHLVAVLAGGRRNIEIVVDSQPRAGPGDGDADARIDDGVVEQGRSGDVGQGDARRVGPRDRVVDDRGGRHVVERDAGEAAVDDAVLDSDAGDLLKLDADRPAADDDARQDDVLRAAGEDAGSRAGGDRQAGHRRGIAAERDAGGVARLEERLVVPRSAERHAGGHRDAACVAAGGELHRRAGRGLRQGGGKFGGRRHLHLRGGGLRRESRGEREEQGRGGDCERATDHGGFLSEEVLIRVTLERRGIGRDEDSTSPRREPGDPRASARGCLEQTLRQN